MTAETPTALSLARKWRPRRFADVVGQEPAVRVLQNALARGRLHPVLLFTGLRGVGKTTLARLVAKALNCEQGVVAEPCNACDSCRALEAGTFVDFLEIDAASRTRVEETRELLANVPYTPASGRFRVYLIDEVHMLSGHSFNALLKTLEEPPAHVIFILATTDPEKVPATVLSRCLRLSLRRVPPEACRERLARILDAEGVGYDEESLRLVAQAADGSLRDALSLVDQAVAYGDGTLRGEEIAALLGTVDEERLVALLLDADAGNAAGVRDFLEHGDERGLDARVLVERLLGLLSRVALDQLGPAGVEEGRAHARAVRTLAPETVQIFYEIAAKAYEELRVTDDPRTVLRMALVRMLAFRPIALAAAEGEIALPPPPPAVAPRPSSPRPRASVARASPPPPSRAPEGGGCALRAADPPPREAPAPPSSPPGSGPLPPLGPDSWLEVVPRLALPPLAREAAAHLGWGRLEDGGTLVLRVSSLHAGLFAPGVEAALSETLRSADPRVKGLRIEPVETADFPTHAQARRRAEERARGERRAALLGDPVLQEIVQNWGGQIRGEAVRDGEEDPT